MQWFWSQENKVWHCFHCFPIYEMIGLDTMILVFWMLSFRQTFSLSSFNFINRFFSSSSLSAIRVVSSAYLRLLKSLQLWPILCDPMHCSPLDSSVHGILQARTLEWVAISFSRGSSWPRDRTHVSCIGRQILYHLSYQERLRIGWSRGKLSSVPLLLASLTPNFHQVREASWEKSYPERGRLFTESQGYFSLCDGEGGPKGGQFANQDREASERGGGEAR